MAKKKEIDCKQCGSDMKRHKYSSGNGKVLVGLVLVVAGVAAFAMVPVFGWIIGGLLVLIGLGMGGKRHKGWKCGDCGYFFEAK